MMKIIQGIATLKEFENVVFSPDFKKEKDSIIDSFQLKRPSKTTFKKEVVKKSNEDLTLGEIKKIVEKKNKKAKDFVPLSIEELESKFNQEVFYPALINTLIKDFNFRGEFDLYHYTKLFNKIKGLNKNSDNEFIKELITFCPVLETVKVTRVKANIKNTLNIISQPPFVTKLQLENINKNIKTKKKSFEEEILKPKNLSKTPKEIKQLVQDFNANVSLNAKKLTVEDLYLKTIQTDFEVYGKEVVQFVYKNTVKDFTDIQKSVGYQKKSKNLSLRVSQYNNIFYEFTKLGTQYEK